MTGAKLTRVPVQLDKERHLRFDFNAIERIEALTGSNAMAKSAFTGTHLRAAIFACLYADEVAAAMAEGKDPDTVVPELSLRQVGAHMHPGNTAELTKALARARGLNSPAEDEGGKPDAAEDAAEESAQAPTP